MRFEIIHASGKQETLSHFQIGDSLTLSDRHGNPVIIFKRHVDIDGEIVLEGIAINHPIWDNVLSTEQFQKD